MDSIKELRLAIWQSKIAIKIELCKSSNVKDQTSPTQYILMYSQHYPLFYLLTIFEYFKQWINPAMSPNHLALYYKNKAVPLNIPIGVIIDQLNQKNKIQYVPICFTIKLESTSQLQTLNDEIKNQFYFNLKLSILAKFKHNKGLAMLNQYLSDQEISIWFEQLTNTKSKFEDDLKQIFDVYERILDSKEAQIINLPVRIFILGYPGRIQCLINITNENETIGFCLKSILPIVFIVQNQTFINTSQQILFNGVELDQNIPALYFYNFLYSIDGFCYFSVV